MSSRRFLIGLFDAEPFRDGGPRRPRGGDALAHRHAHQRDERHDVHGAEARMLAAMLAQVDVGNRALEQREDRPLNGCGRSDEREDGAVVRGIGRRVEEPDA